MTSLADDAILWVKMPEKISGSGNGEEGWDGKPLESWGPLIVWQKLIQKMTADAWGESLREGGAQDFIMVPIPASYGGIDSKKLTKSDFKVLTIKEARLVQKTIHELNFPEMSQTPEAQEAAKNYRLLVTELKERGRRVYLCFSDEAFQRTLEGLTEGKIRAYLRSGFALI